MSYFTEFFKLASDETRLRIIILLAQQELAVCEICGILNISQPKVSKHLAKLRDMNFVVDTRKEKFIFYSLNINNNIIGELVSNIVKDIEEYPQLNEDSIRLKESEVYLKECKTVLND